MRSLYLLLPQVRRPAPHQQSGHKIDKRKRVWISQFNIPPVIAKPLMPLNRAPRR
jgi:hypothetical protein